MNKLRRDCARKLGIWLAFLVVISVFFYAPMEVNADSIMYSSMQTTTVNSKPFNQYGDVGVNPQMDSLVNGRVYRINIGFSCFFNTDYPSTGRLFLNAYTFRLCFPGVDVVLFTSTDMLNISTGFHSVSGSDSFIYLATDDYDAVDWSFATSGFLWSSDVSAISHVSGLSYWITSIEELSVDESTVYQNGYSEGFSQGEASGYNQGYLDGEERGYDDGYDAGFESGSSSVDTDEYFQAGYDSGYDAGYEQAYDLGYAAAISRLEDAGADTTDYPVEVFSWHHDPDGYIEFWGSTGTSYVSDSVIAQSVAMDVEAYEFNPHHTYKVLINFVDKGVKKNEDLTYKPSWSDVKYFFGFGAYDYYLSWDPDGTTEFFIPGYNMASAFDLGAVFYGLGGASGAITEYAFYYDSATVQILDYGPSGDTQNHIANQTDQLTNGYDSSTGNSMNSDFSASLNSYQTSEDSLFSTARSGLDDFTFVDFSSYPTLVTAMSFVTSLMTSIYISMGGESGPIGIVLSVLFSVMLVSMIIGLYRYYQSKEGGGD